MDLSVSRRSLCSKLKLLSTPCCHRCWASKVSSDTGPPPPSSPTLVSFPSCPANPRPTKNVSSLAESGPLKILRVPFSVINCGLPSRVRLCLHSPPYPSAISQEDQEANARLWDSDMKVSLGRLEYMLCQHRWRVSSNTR